MNNSRRSAGIARRIRERLRAFHGLGETWGADILKRVAPGSAEFEEEFPVISGSVRVVADEDFPPADLAPPAAPGAPVVLVCRQVLAPPAAADRTVCSLLRAGVAAVIGEAIAPGFQDAAHRAGLPALIIDRTAGIRTGDQVRIDVETRRVANLSSGDRHVVRNLGDEAVAMLRAAAGRGLQTNA